jgi:hypothetical protein
MSLLEYEEKYADESRVIMEDVLPHDVSVSCI